jgi:hypothetical protein
MGVKPSYPAAVDDSPKIFKGTFSEKRDVQGNRWRVGQDILLTIVSVGAIMFLFT